MGNNIKVHLHCVAEEPHLRRHWCELSQTALNVRDYLTAYWAASKAIGITDKCNDDDEWSWGAYPYDLAGTAAYYVGLFEQSLDNYVQAWRMSPKDDRYIGNVKFVRRHLHRYKIIILWPTVRPMIFRERYNDWLEKCCNADRIKIRVVVATRKQRDELSDFDDVLVAGTDRPGVAYATYIGARDLDGLPDDIFILASDDFHPPQDWDAYIYDKLNEYAGCIIVNDMCNPSKVRRPGVVTIPIMDFSCLLKLNRFIYHPSYYHLWSDNELHDCLSELGLIRDYGQPDQPVFEHRHWYHGYRDKDTTDEVVHKYIDADRDNYLKRSNLPLTERLCYQT